MFSTIPINIHLGLRSLGRNRLRTTLTMLGIIIGVAAVLTMVGLGTGARSSVEGEVSSAGTNLLFVKAGNYTRGGEGVGIAAGRGAARTLVPADAVAIGQHISGIQDISPGLSLRTFITGGEARVFARVQGIAANYARMYSWQIQQGNMFAQGAGDQAVLGRVLAEQLFGQDGDPLGKQVNLRGRAYEVVGIIEGLSEDHREVLFLPWQAMLNSLDRGHLDSLTIAAEKAGEASRIADEITDLLRERHGLTGGDQEPGGYLASRGGIGGEPDDFTVETQAGQALTKGLYTPAAAFALANLPRLDEVTLNEMADTLDRASGTMTALLASIAGVSLIVGGIGIMNIMLVSITERTREIGLRMATGARAGDVAMQFLIEAVTLSVIGGFVGLLLGILSTRLIGWSLGWSAQVSLAAMAVAIGIAALVGLVFGSYPARRAAQLDPIDALRTE